MFPHLVVPPSEAEDALIWVDAGLSLAMQTQSLRKNVGNSWKLEKVVGISRHFDPIGSL